MADLRVIIVGGGASGVLTGAALLRSSDRVHVTIVEPRERLGTGTAYATDCPLHLLNVPAGKMSAFFDEPEHFLRWLAVHEPGRYDGHAYVPRSVYGSYLQSVAAHAEEAARDRWSHVRALAVDVAVEGERIRITDANGATHDGDVAVLASGNAAPAAWPNLSADALTSRRYFPSAWATGALTAGASDEAVLLLGTGLTAIDGVLGLHAAGHRGVITMVSRRGLLPHEHRLFDTPPEANPEATTIPELIGAVRSRNWRLAVDALRARTNDVWQGLTLSEQRRFVRHLLPYWNVHRHRLAPEAARLIAELIASGRLRMLAGRTEEIVAECGALRVPVRLRGSEERVEISAARIINCSGPEHDVTKLNNPFMRRLLAQGLAAQHPLRIGLQIAPKGALIDTAGNASERLFAIGPVRFGTLIETTAIPEIRVQAAEFADLITESGARRRSTA